MPTRQPTPGPSNIVLQPLNAAKRPISEDPEDSRESKKMRKDFSSSPSAASAVSMNVKDKKKRRKRKRKMSIVVDDFDLKPRSTSRSAPASTSMPNVKPPSTTLVTATNGEVEIEHEEPVPSSSDKGKGKDTSESPAHRSPTPPVAEQPSASASAPTSTSAATDSAQEQIARLTEQLATQTTLLDKHKSHLGTINQSLTCQICLDLLHKPFALAPCGHVACHSCLVRWFTALPNGVPNNEDIEQILNGVDGRHGRHLAKRKTCPICRAVVYERPVEVWGIKDMVGVLVKSGLVELPVPLPAPALTVDTPAGENNSRAGPPDPWNNIFRRAPAAHLPHLHHHGGDIFLPPMFYAAPPPPPAGNANGGPEQMGMYDAEDGGIYRCLDCMHEIWDGRCTSCGRAYPGHPQMSDSEDDEEGAAPRRRAVRGPRNVGYAQLLDYLRHRANPEELGDDFAGEPDIVDLAEDDSIDDEDEHQLGGWGRFLDDLEAQHDLAFEDEDDFSGDEDERDRFEEEEDHFDRHELMGVAHHPLLGFAVPPPLGFPVPGEILYADFTDDELAGRAVEEGVAHVEEVNDEDGEGEEEGYESSFIDDDEERHRRRHLQREYGHPVQETIDILDLSAEDEDEYGSEDDNIANTMARLRQHRGWGQDEAILIPSDDEIDLTGDDDDNIGGDSDGGVMAARALGRSVRVGVGRRRGRGAPMVILDSDEEDDDDDIGGLQW